MNEKELLAVVVGTSVVVVVVVPQNFMIMLFFPRTFKYLTPYLIEILHTPIYVYIIVRKVFECFHWILNIT